MKILDLKNFVITLNPRYEAVFNPDNIDQDCDRIASLMNVEADFIKEALDAGLYKQPNHFRLHPSYISLRS